MSKHSKIEENKWKKDRRRHWVPSGDGGVGDGWWHQFECATQVGGRGGECGIGKRV